MKPAPSAIALLNAEECTLERAREILSGARPNPLMAITPVIRGVLMHEPIPYTPNLKPASKPKPVAPRKPRVDPARVIELRDQGLTIAVIGERLEIGRTTIWKILQANGQSNPQVKREDPPPRKPVASVKAYASPSLHDAYCEQVTWHLRQGRTMDEALDAVLETPDVATSEDPR